MDESTVQNTDGTRSRRHLLKIAAATPPALIAMSSRPSWAGSLVSPSAYCSIHPNMNTNITLTRSNQPKTTTGGCGHSSSVWKTCYQTSANWHCGYGNFQCPENSNFRTLCGKGHYGSNCSFGQLLCDTKWQPSSPYDRDFCAAYLSACNRSSGQVCAGYPCTPEDIANMYCGTYKECGVTWTRTQAHTYLQSICNDAQCAGNPCAYGWSNYF